MAKSTEPVYRGDVIYSGQDEYGDVAVVQEATSRTLHFGSTARQSTMLMADPTRLALSYTRCMVGGLLLAPPPRSALVLGLGGGSLPKFLLRHFAECRIDAVEMRACVVAVARRYFSLPEDERLALHVEKAEDFLSRTDIGPYDWLLIDLYDCDGMASVLDESDLFLRCRALLSERAVLSVNLWTGNRAEFLDRIRARLAEAFGQRVLLLPVAGKSNTVALAFNAPMPVLNDQRLYQRAAQLQALYEIEFVDFLRDSMRYNAMA